MTLKDKLFSFHGRLRRRDWWLLNIGLAVAGFLLNLALAWIVSGGKGDAWLTSEPFDPAYMTSYAVDAVFAWPYLALAAKRAHDRDRGAGLVIALSVAIYPLAYATDFLSGEMSALVMFAAGLLGLVILVYLGVPDGTPGPNRHGPSPKHGNPAEVF